MPQNVKRQRRKTTVTKKAPIYTSTGEGGLLEGISSLHSWIKTQTMIKPNKLNRRGGSEDADDSENGKDDTDPDVIIHLTSFDPQVSWTTVQFNHHKKEFVTVKASERFIDHLDIQSTIELKGESVVTEVDKNEESKLMVAADLLSELGWSSSRSAESKSSSSARSSVSSRTEESPAPNKKNQPERKLTTASTASGQPSAASGSLAAKQAHSLTRGTQTKWVNYKDWEGETDMQPRENFSGTANQWIIYDEYVAYEKIKDQEEDETGSQIPVAPSSDLQIGNNPPHKVIRSNKRQTPAEKVELTKKILKSAKILERMVNQNTFKEVIDDYRYWEDVADEFREKEGTLLPLWKFSVSDFEETLEVTGVCWNSEYFDLFGVCYGSYNFYQNNLSGYLAVFSFKNANYPEYLYQTESGVMSLDFHPDVPNLIVVGMYDGNVAVFNIKSERKEPILKSSSGNGKHLDVVWKVKWNKKNLDGYQNFTTVAGDGKVRNWTLVKHCLRYTDLITIYFNQDLINISLDTELFDGLRTIAFNPGDCTKFLVGTETGKIHLCTTEYSSEILRKYCGHTTPINNIQWSPFISRVFLSCATEFILKLWIMDHPEPVIRFDLSSQVTDICWSPYSSTVFAACTLDGKVHVYDLNISKYHSLTCQSIVARKKAVLNTVIFNPEDPILLVGDSRGIVHSLKLSPNLRKKCAASKRAAKHGNTRMLKQIELEKLERVIKQVGLPFESSSSEEEQPDY